MREAYKKFDKIELVKANICEGIPFSDSTFDVVTMLAIYEHLGKYREYITNLIYHVLKKDGIVILTVPNKAVDYVLYVLVNLKLIDGMSLEQHDHFKASDTIHIFSKCGFHLKHKSKFQFGLNNLFIFKK